MSYQFDGLSLRKNLRFECKVCRYTYKKPNQESCTALSAVQYRQLKSKVAQ